jgi:hypothetical protein
MLKSSFSRDRLRLTVVELAVRIDVQPTSRMAVLVALDLAGLALPLVVGSFIWQGCLDWSVVPVFYVGSGANVFGCVNTRLGKSLAA